MNVAHPSPLNSGHQAQNDVQDAEIWMVRNDDKVVGPVTLGLIERGVRARKIPASAEIAHCDDQFHADAWQPLTLRFPQLAGSGSDAEDVEAAAIVEVEPVHARRPLPPPASTRPRQTLPSPAPQSAPQPQAQPDGAPASHRYPEEPVSIPKHGLLGSVFGITFG